MKSRILSSAIAIVYMITAYFARGPEVTLRLGIFLILPLACIWFSEVMGDYTGLSFGARPPITRTTPGCFIAFGGWLLLCLPAIYALAVYFGARS
jgi:hypothetical protein